MDTAKPRAMISSHSSRDTETCIVFADIPYNNACMKTLTTLRRSVRQTTNHVLYAPLEADPASYLQYTGAQKDNSVGIAIVIQSNMFHYRHYHWLCSPRWVLASSSKCRQRPLSWVPARQFLQPSFLASSSYPSLHLDFGRPRPG